MIRYENLPCAEILELVFERDRLCNRYTVCNEKNQYVHPTFSVENTTYPL